MTLKTLTLREERPHFLSSFAKDALIVVGASFLICLFSQVVIPLPFTPVPVATQAHVILFLAALLGSRLATMATVLFIVEGSLGLPVFSQGKAGLLCLAGPTGGYLLGYIAAAFATGALVERMKQKTVIKTFLAMTVGNLVIYGFGAAWLSSFVGVKASLLLGVLPFIMGDVLKLLVCVRGLKAFRFFSA